MNWLAVLTVAFFSIAGFLIAALVLATLLTSLPRRDRRAVMRFRGQPAYRRGATRL